MRKLAWFVGIGLVAASAVALQQKWVTVTIDGRELSAKGRVIDGQLYVPVAAVAKAYNLDVEFDGGAKATLTTQGGANAVAGAEGKAGEWLLNGKTRCMIKAAPIKEDGILVLSIELRNAEKTRKQYLLGFDQTKITLYDTNGSEALGTLVDRNRDYANWVEPGSTWNFKVKFAAPEGFEAKRAVLYIFTQKSGSKPESDVFRVSFSKLASCTQSRPSIVSSLGLNTLTFGGRLRNFVPRTGSSVRF